MCIGICIILIERFWSNDSRCRKTSKLCHEFSIHMRKNTALSISILKYIYVVIYICIYINLYMVQSEIFPRPFSFIIYPMLQVCSCGYYFFIMFAIVYEFIAWHAIYGTLCIGSNSIGASGGFNVPFNRCVPSIDNWLWGMCVCICILIYCTCYFLLWKCNTDMPYNYLLVQCIRIYRHQTFINII